MEALKEETPTYAPPTDEELTGLGGWLFWVGLSIVGGLIQPILSLKELGKIFTPNVWINLAYESAELYTPEFIPYAFYNLAIIFFLYFTLLYLLYLFFNKKRSFPKIYSIILVIYLVLAVINQMLDYWFYLKLFTADEVTFNFKSIVVVGLRTLIFCAYMRRSRRVKLTFING